MEANCVFEASNSLGEGPLWHQEEEALYWVDILGHLIQRWRPETKEYKAFDMGVPAAILGRRATGGFLVAAGDQLATWPGKGHSLEQVTRIQINNEVSRFNDGAVDRQGRFWAGTMGGGAINSLYCYEDGGPTRIKEGGIGISNGIGWSPDQQRMYFTDSEKGCIYLYDFDASSAMIENRRVFVRVPAADGVPDGLTVDEEGCVWSANWDGWRVTRYDPQGVVMETVRLPVQRPTSCTFGGKNLNELYITSANVGLSADQLKEQPLAGGLFCLQANVRGLAENMFGMMDSEQENKNLQNNTIIL